MAETSGTATDYLDLLDQVVTFLTGLAGPETWVVNKNTTSGFTTDGEVYLQGPGLTGADEVFVNIATSHNTGSGYYLWQINGAIAFDTGLSMANQVGAVSASIARPILPLANSNMAFQLVANGRRFVLTVTISGSVESCYCGFFESYATPSEYPFPLFIGATHTSTTALPSDITTAHAWWARNAITNTGQISNAAVRGPGGSWFRLKDWGNQGTTLNTNEATLYVLPTGTVSTTHLICKNEVNNYPIHDVQVYLHDIDYVDGSSLSSYQLGNKYAIGRLDGVYWTTGFGLTAGDTITYSGDDYLAFQNCFRSGVADFQLLKLV